jgi:hypothetical protein
VSTLYGRRGGGGDRDWRRGEGDLLARERRLERGLHERVVRARDEEARLLEAFVRKVVEREVHEVLVRRVLRPNAPPRASATPGGERVGSGWGVGAADLGAVAWALPFQRRWALVGHWS